MGLSDLVTINANHLLEIVIPRDVKLRTVVKDEDGRVTSLERGDPEGGRFSEV
jgi:hypothetical protein